MRRSSPVGRSLLALTVGVACRGDAGGPGSDAGSSVTSAAEDDTANPPDSSASEDDPGTSSTSVSTPDEDTAASESTEGADSENPCTIPVHTDDLVLERDDARSMPARMRRIAVYEDRWAACGSGMLVFGRHDDSESQSLTLDADCAALAFADLERVVVSLEGERGRVQLVDTTTARVTSDWAFDTPSRGLVVDDERVRVAAGSGGILEIALTGTEATPWSAAPEDAHDLARAEDGDHWLVADGPSGLVHLDATGNLEDRLELSAPALRVFAWRGHALVLQGFRGFEVIDLSGDQLTPVARGTRAGVTMDAAVFGEVAMIVQGDHVLRLGLDAGEVVELAREVAPSNDDLDRGWFSATTLLDPHEALFALGSELVPLRLGEGHPAPHVQATRARLLMKADGTARSAVVFANLGRADAIIHDYSGQEDTEVRVDEDDLPPEIDGCPGQHRLAPGERALVRFERPLSDTAPVITHVDLHTNDPGTPAARAPIVVNRSTPETGRERGELSGFDWHGRPFELAELRGQVVYLKLISAA